MVYVVRRRQLGATAPDKLSRAGPRGRRTSPEAGPETRPRNGARAGRRSAWRSRHGRSRRRDRGGRGEGVPRERRGDRGVAVSGKLYAFSDICTHRGCNLSLGGEIDGTEHHVRMPRQHVRHDHGAVLEGPATEPVARYPVREEDGDLLIEADGGRPPTVRRRRRRAVRRHGGGDAPRRRVRRPDRLIGDGGAAPYERPPLSKEYLRGEDPLEQILVRPRRVVARTGRRERDRARTSRSSTACADGDVSPVARRSAFDAFLMATGVQNRKIAAPGARARRRLDLRTIAEGDRIRAAARTRARVVCVGMGFIGAEVAASLRELGVRRHGDRDLRDRVAPGARRRIGRRARGDPSRPRRDDAVQRRVARFEGDGRLERVVTREGDRRVRRGGRRDGHRAGGT